MCGIFCTIWLNGDENKNTEVYTSCKCYIQRRGPDDFVEKTQDLVFNWKACFASSVLWMQGPRLVEQPAIDSNGNVLLWNGDIFSGDLAKDDVSDTETLLNAFKTSDDVPGILQKVSGPYSIVYYQASQKLLYFARDPIGRHSLLLSIDKNSKSLTLSSTAHRRLDGTIEVPSVGIFFCNLENYTFGLIPWNWNDPRCSDAIVHLQTLLGTDNFTVECPVRPQDLNLLSDDRYSEPKFCQFDHFDEVLSASMKNVNPIEISPTEKKLDIMQTEIVNNVMKRLSIISDIQSNVSFVLKLLRISVKERVSKKPNYCKVCIRFVLAGESIVCDHAKLGILFSGGLDSTILAALAHEFVSSDETIDLINVAFEKVTRADRCAKNSKDSSDSTVSFDVPDRKTGRQALDELIRICPRRKWNFIECNITQEELKKYRSTRIRDLVYPLSTILDDSLGCALWFASRGSGKLSNGEPYESPCRILLLGMGADELFGGYTRHRTTLRRGGWSALSRELDAELARISERNLGRDDRVVSDHGRQSRLPYLDERVVEYVSNLKAWERCYPTELMPPGLGDKLLLRLVAYKIGLYRTANFPKRAFQFGSRIANNKENAKDVSNFGCDNTNI